jgi:predicted Zn-dependent protease
MFRARHFAPHERGQIGRRYSQAPVVVAPGALGSDAHRVPARLAWWHPLGRQRTPHSERTALAERVVAHLVSARRVPQYYPVVHSVFWVRSLEYADQSTQFRATIKYNPLCWMCHNNLALLLMERGELAEAESHLLASLALNPRNAEAHNDFGILLSTTGRLSEALTEHLEAVKLDPKLSDAYYNLGVVYVRLGRNEEAPEALRQETRLPQGVAAA